LQIINNPTPAANELFGYAVSISGTTAVISAPHDDPSGVPDASTAYVFDTGTDALLQTLNNPTPAVNDWFGAALALSGTTMFVGAYRDDTAAGTSRAVYIFDTTSGALLQTLISPSGIAADNFGRAVDISGTTAIVGSLGYDEGATVNAGAAYIYDVAIGNLLQTLVNTDPTAADLFGNAVAISGDFPLVSALRDDEGATDTVYVFDLATGNLLQTLNNPAPQNEDYFGETLAATDTSALVSVPHNNPGDNASAGSVYVFEAVVPLLAALPLRLAGPGSIALVRIKRR
jgi:hypothetical protein